MSLSVEFNMNIRHGLFFCKSAYNFRRDRTKITIIKFTVASKRFSYLICKFMGQSTPWLGFETYNNNSTIYFLFIYTTIKKICYHHSFKHVFRERTMMKIIGNTFIIVHMYLIVYTIIFRGPVPV